MDIAIGILGAIIFGGGGLWAWVMAFSHLNESTVSMFSGQWMFKPELFDEEGNKYRRIGLLLQTGAIIFFIAFVVYLKYTGKWK